MPAYQFIQYLLFCMAGMLTFQFARGGVRRHLGQVLLHATAALAALFAIAFDWNQPSVLGLLALLVLGPHLMTQLYQRAIAKAVQRSDFDQALELSRQRLGLFPFQMYRRQVRLFEGLLQARLVAQTESLSPARILSEIAQQPGLEPLYEYAMVAELSQLAAQRDWSGIIRKFEEGVRLPEGLYEVSSRLLLVRAHCELGALEPALDSILALEGHPHWSQVRGQLHLAWLSVLATGGRRRAVEELFSHQLNHLPGPVALGWRARAAWAAGAPSEGRALLVPLLQIEGLSEPIRQMLEDRLRQMAVMPPGSSSTIELALDRLEQRVRLDHLLFQSMRQFGARPAVGWLMIALLASFTSAAILADPGPSIAHFGVFAPLLKAEPWRLLTALFLQDGWAHLLMNGLTLILLGSVVEGIFHKRSTLFLFLSAGIVANLIVAIVHPQQLLIGAQGALMGWFGALLAVFVRARGIIPANWRVARLRGFLIVVCSQLLIALLLTRVGIETLPIGALVGFLLGLLLPMRGLPYHEFRPTLDAGLLHPTHELHS